MYPPPPPINPHQPQVHYHYQYPYPTQQVWSPAVAAILSLFIPGVGQMYKGRVGEGILWLIFTPIGYIFLILPGLIMHIICIINAAQGNPHKQGG
jgi:TM2 domain-containing membrane protein YozV